MSASQTMAMAEISTPAPRLRSSKSDTHSSSMLNAASQGELQDGLTRNTERKATKTQARTPTPSTGTSHSGAGAALLRQAP